MPTFRVQLMSPAGEVLREENVSTTSADRAAVAATGDPAIQRGGKLGEGVILRAKVYLELGGARTLTRFFGQPASDEHPRLRP